MNRQKPPGVLGFGARLFGVVIAAAVFAAAPAWGLQDAVPSPSPTTKPAGPGPEDEGEGASILLQRQSVQDRIAQIQAATDLPEATKTELLGLYRQTLDQLTVVENWEAKIQELQSGRERAPDLLKEIKARIEQLTARSTTQPTLDVSPEDTVESLAQKLAGKEADLRAAQDAAKKLDEEAENRAARKTAIPDLLADANQRRERITKDLGTVPPAGTLAQVALARRTLLLAQRAAVESEIKEYEEELRFYEARSAVLTARREEMRLTVAAAQAAVTAWQELVRQRRQEEIERQKQLAEEELRRAPAALRELIESNAALTDEWETIGRRIKTLQERVKTVKELIDSLSKEFSALRKKDQEDPDALADVIGLEMRRKRQELVLLRSYERELRALKKESARAERRVWEIDEDVVALADLEAPVADKVSEIVKAAPQTDPAKITQRLEMLYTARRDKLKQMQPDYLAYSEDLRELRAAESRLLAKAAQFQEFIDQHILWLRSAGPLYTARLPAEWRGQATHWLAIGRSLLLDVPSRPVVYFLATIVLVSLLAARRRIRALLRDVSQRVARPLSDSYRLTLRAGVCTVLLSLPWALLLWFVGWRVGASVDVTDATAYELAQAAASGLRVAALVLVTLSLLRNVCRAKGLAETHFRWEPRAVRLTRRNADWFRVIAVPVVFIVYATENHADSAWRASIGRMALIVGLVALSVFLQRLFRPSAGVLAGRLRRQKTGWLYNLRHVWFVLAVGAPLVLAAVSAAGYHYTAVQFSEDLARTAGLGLGLLLIHAMLVRWLFVAQRRLAIEQARKRRAAAEEARTAPPATPETLDLDEAKLDLVTIGDQTRQLLRGMAAFALFVGLWVIWADMLPALSFMRDIELWPYTVTAAAVGGENAAPDSAAVATSGPRVEYITLAHLAMAIVIAVVTYILARNIPGLLEIAILQKLALDTGGRYAITALARYAIVVIGTILTFGSIGIGWSKVQWLVAAMTVGLGFGLQEIFANFVSGVMLLFERPIRIGDTVTVGEVTGTVARIRIRATTITDWDRKELVIPNKEFVTGQVINWTLSDSVIRIIIPVGIAYGSDTDLAEELLYKTAREASHVLAEPKPKVLFMGFGDSALNFELRVFVSNIDHFLSTRHLLHKAIDREFRKAGVVIAFPQRDVHVYSTPQSHPIVEETKQRAPDSAHVERMEQVDEPR